MIPASSGLGRSKTAWRFVHRRVSGLSAFRLQISCKRSSRRWSERSPCCRNGKGRWKRNWKKNADFMFSPCFSPAQQCSWASWCYGRVWAPKIRPPQCCCAWHWWGGCFVCASAASLLWLLVSGVQVDWKCCYIIAAAAVSSWEALLWP